MCIWTCFQLASVHAFIPFIETYTHRIGLTFDPFLHINEVLQSCVVFHVKPVFFLANVLVSVLRSLDASIFYVLYL